MAAPIVTPGLTLGHFRLIEEIGAGGMGIVYRARDTRLERDVAVKILNAKTLSSDSARKRFRREALILSRLNHPNVESVYDFHSDQGIDYLVMEHISGVSLADRLEQGALSKKELVSIGIQLARGLAAAHEQKIIHRDLKPANLKVTPENVLKILDFGLAQFLTLPEDETVTQTAAVQNPAAGTPAYISPEQIAGKEPDTRSDIYSAGVVLYELATGSKPFSEHGEILRWAILHTTPPAPRTKNSAITPDLESVILKCLQKGPGLRYQSANELLEDLKEIARGSSRQQAVTAQPRPLWRFKQWLVVTLVLIAAVVGAILIRKLGSRAAPPGMSVVVAEFENRTGDPVFDQTPRELVSAALNQSKQASVFPASRLPDVLRRMQRPETSVVDEKIATEICTREGLHSVISGSISKLGGSYLVLVRSSNCNGDVVSTMQKEFSNPEELPAAIDEISTTVRHGWGESRAAIQRASQPLAIATSNSLEALKLYSSGKRQLYLGNPQAAASLLTNAIELDDNFAMAHAYLGIAYEHLQNYDRAREELARAAQLSDRVTEREKEKILGAYALSRYDTAKAISHYQALAALSPEDPAVHISLAESYRMQLRFDLAISEATKAVDLEPSPGPKISLAIYYFLSGDSQRSIELAREVLKDHPEDWRALYLLGSCYSALGKSAEANAIWHRMLALGGDAASQARAAMADAAQAHDDLPEAIAQLEDGLIADADVGNAYELTRKRIQLAELYRVSGNHQAFIRSLNEIQRTTSPDLIFLLGKLDARSGRKSEAQQKLHILDQLSDKTPRAMSFCDLLRSEIAAGDGQFTAAVRSARQGVQHFNSPLAIETLARAYELAGNKQDAANQYETLLSRANERQFDDIDSPALEAVAAARYRLGVLYQSLGRGDLAKEQFLLLLSYAAEAKQTGRLYEDTKKRLAQVTGKSAVPASQPPPHTEPTH